MVEKTIRVNMKKRVFVFAFLILILIPLISSVDFQMNESFSQGETLLAKLSGNFIQKPLQQNIFLYRDKVRAALDYHLVQVDNDFYLYAQLLGKVPANYSVVLTNVKYYTILQKISEEDIVRNFTITDDIAAFSINPGFIETKDNFSLEIKNLLDKEITISVDIGEKETKYVSGLNNSSSNSTSFWETLFGGSSSTDNHDIEAVDLLKTQEFILSASQTKIIDILLTPSSETKIQTVILSSGETSYEIPVHLIASEITPVKNETPIRGELYFNPSFLNLSKSTSDPQEVFQIRLTNTGEKLKNVSIYLDTFLSDFFSISSSEIETLDKDQTFKLNLSTTSFNYSLILGDSFSRELNGNLYAKSGNESANMKINLNIFKSYISNVTVLSCPELKGNICSSNLTCSGSIKLTKEGNCCIGKCVISEPPKISLALLGWILVILVLVFLIWFFKFRYKGVRSDPNLNKYLQKK